MYALLDKIRPEQSVASKSFDNSNPERFIKALWHINRGIMPSRDITFNSLFVEEKIKMDWYTTSSQAVEGPRLLKSGIPRIQLRRHI